MKGPIALGGILEDENEPTRLNKARRGRRRRRRRRKRRRRPPLAPQSTLCFFVSGKGSSSSSSVSSSMVRSRTSTGFPAERRWHCRHYSIVKSVGIARKLIKMGSMFAGSIS